MAITFIQQLQRVVKGPASTSITLSFLSNTTAGNQVVVCAAAHRSNFTVSSITGMGATWIKVKEVTNASGNTCSIWIGQVVTAGFDVTVTYSGIPNVEAVNMQEFSGLSQTADGTSGVSAGTASTSVSPGNITTTNAADLVIAMGMFDTAGAITDPGAPWNALTGSATSGGADSSNSVVGYVYQITTATGSFNPSFTDGTSSINSAAMAVFKATVTTIILPFGDVADSFADPIDNYIADEPEPEVWFDEVQAAQIWALVVPPERLPTTVDVAEPPEGFIEEEPEPETWEEPYQAAQIFTLTPDIVLILSSYTFAWLEEQLVEDEPEPVWWEDYIQAYQPIIPHGVVTPRVNRARAAKILQFANSALQIAALFTPYETADPLEFYIQDEPEPEQWEDAQSALISTLSLDQSLFPVLQEYIEAPESLVEDEPELPVWEEVQMGLLGALAIDVALFSLLQDYAEPQEEEEPEQEFNETQEALLWALVVDDALISLLQDYAEPSLEQMVDEEPELPVWEESQEALIWALVPDSPLFLLESYAEPPAEQMVEEEPEPTPDDAFIAAFFSAVVAALAVEIMTLLNDFAEAPETFDGRSLQELYDSLVPVDDYWTWLFNQVQPTILSPVVRTLPFAAFLILKALSPIFKTPEAPFTSPKWEFRLSRVVVTPEVRIVDQAAPKWEFKLVKSEARYAIVLVNITVL